MDNDQKINQGVIENDTQKFSSKSKENSGRKCLLIVIFILILAIAGIITYLFLSRSTVEGSFKTKKYFCGKDTSGMEGPMPECIFFNTNGEFVNYSDGPTFGWLAGTYEIKNSKITLNIKYLFNIENSELVVSKYEATVTSDKLSNDEFMLEDYLYTATTKKEYNEIASRKGNYSYKDIEEAYKKNPKDAKTYEESKDESDKGDEVLQGLINVLDNSDVELKMDICSECPKADETTQLSCDSKVLDSESIKKIQSELLLHSVEGVYDEEELCHTYQLMVVSGDKSYLLSYTNANDLVITELTSSGEENDYYLLDEGRSADKYLDDMKEFFASLS